MTDASAPRSSLLAVWRWRWWTWGLMLVALMPVVYLLSVPVVFFFDVDIDVTLQVDSVKFCEPGLLLSKRSPVVRRIYGWEWNALEDLTNCRKGITRNLGPNRRYSNHDFR